MDSYGRGRAHAAFRGTAYPQFGDNRLRARISLDVITPWVDDPVYTASETDRVGRGRFGLELRTDDVR